MRGSRLDALARRALDVVVSAVALALLAPLLAAIAIAVRLASGKPVFFVQQRVGRDGVPFGLIKFRTMRPDAPGRGPAVTIGQDPRVTRVGQVLRRWKLDELPQFWNVLRGDMSLVGPRPEVPRYVAGYTPEQRRVLAARPGITDPASLAYADEASVLASYPDPERAYREVVLPDKLERSIAYLEQRTVLSDLWLLLRTAWTVVGGGEVRGGAMARELSRACSATDRR